MGKVSDRSHCGAFVGDSKVSDLVFADDAVILAESLEVLFMALEGSLGYSQSVRGLKRPGQSVRTPWSKRPPPWSKRPPLKMIDLW